MIYRRRRNSSVWHFNRECHAYPRKMAKVYVRREPPTTGVVCRACSAKTE